MGWPVRELMFVAGAVLAVVAAWWALSAAAALGVVGLAVMWFATEADDGSRGV